MSDFHVFQAAIQEKFKEMSESSSVLFETDVDKDEMWNLYLDSFPAGTNEIYRTRREYDCSCCRHFVKKVGNVVALHDGVYTSIWDAEIDDPTFKEVAAAMAFYVKSKPKQAEALAVKEAADKKAQKQRILEIIAKKEDDSLQNMSLEDLKKMAENL